MSESPRQRSIESIDDPEKLKALLKEIKTDVEDLISTWDISKSEKQKLVADYLKQQAWFIGVKF